jgi:hypothetical protein
MPVIGSDSETLKEYLGSSELGTIFLGNTLVQGNDEAIISDIGLVAYYDISNTSSYTSGSSVIFDLTSNNNDMLIRTGVSYSTDNGGILSLTDGYAVATASANLPSGSAVTQPDFSIGYWARWDQFGTSNNPENPFSMGGFGTFGGSSVPGYIAMTNISSSTDLWFGSTFPSPIPEDPVPVRALEVNSTFNSGSWYNIVFTYSGSENVNDNPGLATAYLNGEPIGSGSLSIVISQQGIPITLGVPNGFNVINKGNGFDGDFGVGYIYNRILTTKDIQALYNKDKNRFI